jgi:glycosyltransferase involved in cell wall biosynthesis
MTPNTLHRSAAKRLGISVALCTYNGERYLQHQLESIATQTLPPDELVLCDDGSTDATLSIARHFAHSTPFPVRVIQNPKNLGYSLNFTQAVELCSHPIVALCDQDDIWLPHKLARIEAIMRGDPSVGGVFSDGELIDSSSRPTGGTLWQSFLFDAEDQARFDSGNAVPALVRRNVVTGMTLVFRRDLGYLLRQRPEGWMHDNWMALMLAARSRLIAHPGLLVQYRIHDRQQVGAPATLRARLEWIYRHGLRAFLANMRERNLDEYQRTAAQFDALAQLLRRQGLPSDRYLLAQAEAKAAHARRGAVALSSRHLDRWPSLCTQVDSYEQLSPTGLRALLRDLII